MKCEYKKDKCKIEIDRNETLYIKHRGSIREFVVYSDDVDDLCVITKKSNPLE